MISNRPLLPTLASLKTCHLFDLPMKLLNLPTSGTVLLSFTRRILSQVVGHDIFRALGIKGRSALKCGVVKSAVMRGKSCHTATWRLSEKSSIHTGFRAHHRCMTFFGVTSDFDHNSRHLTPTTLNCGATSFWTIEKKSLNQRSDGHCVL